MKDALGQVKKFEDSELQAFLDEDLFQTQQKLVDFLGVADLLVQSTISRRLKALGMFQKRGN